MKIACLPGESNDQSKWVIWFPVVVDGTQVTCGISYQALWHHFGAECHDPMRVFVTHRKRIEQLTVDLMHRGRFEGTETMLIRSQDIRACREPWRGWFL